MNMDEENKKIKIVGTTNRYQIKKLIEDKNVIKFKKKNSSIDKEENEKEKDNENQLYENQISYLQIKTPTDNPFIKKCIADKINSYRNQDKLKRIYNELLFIKMEEIIDKLLKCQLKCFYCSEDMYILFNIIREMKQWTLDRINNSIGHTNENTIISCLKCNLQRRNKNKDAFLFTKKLILVKNDYDYDYECIDKTSDKNDK